MKINKSKARSERLNVWLPLETKIKIKVFAAKNDIGIGDAVDLFSQYYFKTKKIVL